MRTLMRIKIEEIPSQMEVDPEVGQSHECLLQLKNDIETLMDTNTEADSSNIRAQPTNTNKEKLKSTSKETSCKSKPAIEEPNSSTTETKSESQSS